MKRSNIFSAMESVLTDIESEMIRARENLDARIQDYNELMESTENNPDKWLKESRENSVEIGEAEIALWENAYNYIYENFHKITKDL